MAGSGGNLGVVLGCEAGGAEYVHDARIGGEPGEFNSGLGDREIEHSIDPGKQLERIVGDDDAELAQPRQQAHILAERDRPFLLDGAGDDAVLPAVDGADELPAHAAGCSRHGDLHLVHGLDLDPAASRRV